jgi:hypothetical protein
MRYSLRPVTFATARDFAKQLGMTLERASVDSWRVNFRGASVGAAQHVATLSEAVREAARMSAARAGQIAREIR